MQTNRGNNPCQLFIGHACTKSFSFFFLSCVFCLLSLVFSFLFVFVFSPFYSVRSYWIGALCCQNERISLFNKSRIKISSCLFFLISTKIDTLIFFSLSNIEDVGVGFLLKIMLQIASRKRKREFTYSFHRASIKKKLLLFYNKKIM